MTPREHAEGVVDPQPVVKRSETLDLTPLACQNSPGTVLMKTTRFLNASRYANDYENFVLAVHRLAVPNLKNRTRTRAPHEHSWQVPDGQCVVKLAIFYGFRAPKKGLDGGVR